MDVAEVYEDLSHRTLEPEIRWACEQYFTLRWGTTPAVHALGNELLGGSCVGWSGGLEEKGQPWMASLPLIVPARDVDGQIVTLVRRAVQPQADKKKSMALSHETLGIERGKYPTWYFGHVPDELRAANGAALWITEGEIDYLLLAGLRHAGHLRGGVLGAPGGGANTRWWQQLAAVLDRHRVNGGAPSRVVYSAHPDEAGDKHFEVALGQVGHLIRPPAFTRNKDLTDVMLEYGHEEVVRLLSAAQATTSRFWQLDQGGYAYHGGGRWHTTVTSGSIQAHLRSAGYSPPAAAAQAKVLPAAAGLTFEPQTTEPVIHRDGQTWLNAYNGLPHLVPRPGDHQILRRLVQHLAGPHADYLFDWLAAPLQALHYRRGHIRTRVAVVLYGPGKGVGKGWLAEVMQQVYGPYFALLGQNAIDEAFSPAGLDRMLFLVLNEVCAHSSAQRKGIDKLNTWVTDDYVEYRPMRQQAHTGRAWCNIMLQSNARQPMVAEPEDRRYTYIRVSGGKMPAEFIDQLVSEKRNGWPSVEGFVEGLLRRKIVRHWHAPLDNTERRDQLAFGTPSEMAFADEVVDTGIMPIGNGWLAEQVKREEGALRWCREEGGMVAVSKLRLWQIYQWWAKNNGYRGIVRQPLLVQAVCERIPEARQERAYIGDARVRAVCGIPAGGTSLRVVADPGPAGADRSDSADW